MNNARLRPGATSSEIETNMDLVIRRFAEGLPVRQKLQALRDALDAYNAEPDRTDKLLTPMLCAADELFEALDAFNFWCEENPYRVAGKSTKEGGPF